MMMYVEYSVKSGTNLLSSSKYTIGWNNFKTGILVFYTCIFIRICSDDIFKQYFFIDIFLWNFSKCFLKVFFYPFFWRYIFRFFMRPDMFSKIFKQIVQFWKWLYLMKKTGAFELECCFWNGLNPASNISLTATISGWFSLAHHMSWIKMWQLICKAKL